MFIERFGFRTSDGCTEPAEILPSSVKPSLLSAFSLPPSAFSFPFLMNAVFGTRYDQSITLVVREVTDKPVDKNKKFVAEADD